MLEVQYITDRHTRQLEALNSNKNSWTGLTLILTAPMTFLSRAAENRINFITHTAKGIVYATKVGVK